MRPALATLLTVLVAALTGCTGVGDRSSAPEPTSASPTPTPSPPTASPPARPRDRACYRLDHADAVSPTPSGRSVPCGRPHTSRTYAVGDLDTVAAGHLLAVDSRRVQAQVASTCSRLLRDFLGGGPEARRLSMLRAVWFTPTLDQAAAGANWFRCDVVAVQRNGTLAPLEGPIKGVLDVPQRRRSYAMCGTAEPGTPDFDRVICSSEHTWAATATVPFAGAPYPGESVVRARGETRCSEAGRSVAETPSDFQWGYEWPTREQWGAGQRYGICWAPD